MGGTSVRAPDLSFYLGYMKRLRPENLPELLAVLPAIILAGFLILAGIYFVVIMGHHLIDILVNVLRVTLFRSQT